jgi:maltose O-acetyltransferase
MTEKEKMLGGGLYDASDPQLLFERRRARELLALLNGSREDSRVDRLALLGQLFGWLGENSWIETPFFCDYGTNISVGSSVYVNFNCVILDPARVDIGNHVLFGPNVQIYTATHPIDYRVRRKHLESAKPVSVGPDVWIGGGSIILPGVSIGANSVVGAGSVVTRDIPEGVLAVGNPCQVVRELDRDR